MAAMEIQTAPAPLGLRERKKQRTRQTIVEVGINLFARNGYDETTLVDIAAAAEIAPSTFFNYFPSKLDIVFGLLDAIIDSARERILERNGDEPATDAVLAWVTGDLAAVERPYSEALRLIPRIVESHPELRSENRLRIALLEDIFAEAYARDLGESPSSVHPRIMAAIVLWGMSEVWESWYERHVTDPDFDPAEVLALKAEYLAPALAAGLAALADVPAPPLTD
jgi:AcrR family transcriptional regulator